mmetsp:Transcript_57767/g.162043  ORF Transcript_57767/g.162043 Transcript_57767/m.162043 type:complete len:332 (+) Transcript_57767:610-1605(+)
MLLHVASQHSGKLPSGGPGPMFQRSARPSSDENRKAEHQARLLRERLALRADEARANERGLLLLPVLPLALGAEVAMCAGLAPAATARPPEPGARAAAAGGVQRGAGVGAQLRRSPELRGEGLQLRAARRVVGACRGLLVGARGRHALRARIELLERPRSCGARSHGHRGVFRPLARLQLALGAEVAVAALLPVVAAAGPPEPGARLAIPREVEDRPGAWHVLAHGDPRRQFHHRSGAAAGRHGLHHRKAIVALLRGGECGVLRGLRRVRDDARDVSGDLGRCGLHGAQAVDRRGWLRCLLALRTDRSRARAGLKDVRCACVWACKGAKAL